MKIYVTYPYGRRKSLTEEQCEANVQGAIGVARQLIKKGHIPFVPNLYHYVHKGWEETLNEDAWLTEILLPWIESCDALYYDLTVNKGSEGCRIERQVAHDLGKEIFYDMEDVPDEPPIV